MDIKAAYNIGDVVEYRVADNTEDIGQITAVYTVTTEAGDTIITYQINGRAIVEDSIIGLINFDNLYNLV